MYITSGFRSMSGLIVLLLCQSVYYGASGQIGREDAMREVVNAKAESRATAVETMVRLKRLLTPGAIQWINISSDEVGQLELSEPIVVFQIKIDGLRTLSPSTNAYATLGTPMRILYPLSIQKQPRASLSIIRNPKGWEFGAIGGTNLTRLLDDGVRTIRSRSNFYYAVQIPSLDLYFLGEGLSSGWNLIAVQSDARLSMKKGDAAPAVPTLLSVATIYGLR